MRLALLVFSTLAPIHLACSAPRAADPRIELATAMSRSGDWADAAALWNEIYLASGLTDHDAGLASAEAFRGMGDLRAALARLTELSQRAPQRADVALARAEVLERLGRAADSRAEYERALDLGAAEVRVFEGLGRVEEGAAALGALRRALQLDPEDAGTRVALGLALADAGQLDEAAPMLDQGFADGAHFPEERLRAARAFGPDARIVPWLEPLAAADPGATEVLRLAGEALLARGQIARAADWLGRAAASDPTDVLSLVGYGRARRAAGDLDGARALLERARALAPEGAELTATNALAAELGAEPSEGS